MKQEIETLHSISHPNIIQILAHNVAERWFVGEYHPGGTLSNHPGLFQGDLLRALTAFRPLVHAVAELHKGRRVHRDIKPHNVFIAADDRLVLGDFGIVFFDDSSRTRITDTYENVGSRDWMPGWAHGMRIEDTTPAFDVFCLGKLLWAMVSGRRVLQLWYHHKSQFELEAMFPADESIKWARVILDRCIVEEEKDCLKSAGELLREIDTVLPAIYRHAQDR
jgi:serine/threonine-protein kinase